MRCKGSKLTLCKYFSPWLIKQLKLPYRHDSKSFTYCVTVCVCVCVCVCVLACMLTCIFVFVMIGCFCHVNLFLSALAKKLAQKKGLQKTVLC